MFKSWQQEVDYEIILDNESEELLLDGISNFKIIDLKFIYWTAMDKFVMQWLSLYHSSCLCLVDVLVVYWSYKQVALS